MTQEIKLWNKSFVTIIIINFLIFINHLMILSTFPFYVEYLGGTETMAGLAAAFFSIVAVICRPFVGWMLNNGIRKKLLFIGLTGMALMPIGYMVISVFFLAFICRMIQGASLAFSNTTVATIATDAIPKPRFAEGMGMFGLATALATAIAPALGLGLMEKMGFPVLFVTAAVSVVIAIVLLIILKAPDVEVPHSTLKLSSLIDRTAVPASLTALIFLFTYGAIENFTAKFADAYRLPSGGIFFAITAVIVLLTRMTAGKVTDRHGEAIFVYLCNLSMAAALILLGLAPSIVTYIIAAVLVGFGFGGLEPALQSMAVAIAPPERRGGANSTFLCAYDIGLGLGGGISGALIDGVGYQKMFLIMVLFNIVSVIIYILIGRNHPSSFRNRIQKQ